MAVTIDLSGRTAWVTGGASGIGAAVAATFNRAGARVVSLDLAYAKVPIGDDDGIVRVDVDLRDSRSVDRASAGLIQAGLGPDILVNNAGITRDGMSWKLTDAAWEEVIDVNLTGAFRMTRACTPFMRTRQGGCIVNVASINGIRGKIGQANYAASKAGLIALTRTLARELGPSGIRVNAVAPGFIDTPMTRTLPDDVRARARAECLIDRAGSPDDVAAAILFLSSPLASHVTAHVLAVDGGQLG